MAQPVRATPQASGATYSGWGSRVGASIIDAAPNIVAFGVLGALFGSSKTTNGTATFHMSGAGFAIYVLFAVGWLVYNLMYLQGTTGQSFGKKIVGIAVYQAGTSRPLGPGLTFARQLVHIVDLAPCLLGFLWPLWDKERRTFADMIMSSRSYKL
ncbi:MAG: hypothetical protein JWR83_3008 [Aeromicrobium sp.]|nr:hypothetical protein [Aeromicrobium sp.]